MRKSDYQNLRGLRRKKQLLGHWQNPKSTQSFSQLEQMGKSGKINRAEPTDLSWIDQFPDCVELFQNAGWLDFFKKIDGYNTEVSYQFAKSYNHDMIVFDTLRFKLTMELIAEATGIKNEGEMWFKKFPFTFDA